ncbi:MAG: DNA-methyltransferase [Rhodanobacter sp.]
MAEDLSQLELFAAVSAAYADSATASLGNSELYVAVADRTGISPTRMTERSPIGRDGQQHNVITRSIRWHQQTLKHMGVLQHVPGERGVWEWVKPTETRLHACTPGVSMVAFSTKLGVAIWGDCVHTFRNVNEPIALCVTSPPYALARQRAYGNPSEAEYVDFIVRALEPIVRHLMPGGSLCLNLGQDIFIQGSPARSMVNERVLLALHDRLGLSLLDRLIWHNPSKPPGPTHWASKVRCHLNVAYEPIFWLATNPALVRADNRRVLEPHTEKHLRLIANGGERRRAEYGDGAHTIREGSYRHATAGRIPRNVIARGNRCADTLQYRRDAAALRLPAHGAVMPLSIPDFLIRFLTEPGDLVVDPFGGTVKTGMAAERLGRRWMVTEQMIDYLRPAAERFRPCDGFSMPSGVMAWPSQSVLQGSTSTLGESLC